jgi:hypothetical protein
MSVRVKEQTAPGTPPSGYVVFYAKADGRLYYKDDTGQEIPVVQGGVLEAPIATTSGTSQGWSSLPAGIRRLRMTAREVSLNGSSNLLVRIGDSGGLVTSGYNSTCVIHTGSGSHTANTTSTAGFIVILGAAGSDLNMTVDLTLLDESTDTWVAAVAGNYTASGNNFSGSGSLVLSGPLDRVFLASANGTDAFDAGQIGLQYDF